MDDDWKKRALAATANSRMGAILRCALDTDIYALPRFTGKAIITSDGFVMADFVDREGDYHMGAFVGGVDTVADNARKLTAYLGLGGDDIAALYAALNGWIGLDYSKKGLGL